MEKQTIYEIYRACRLCGAGGGYKMPIIQNLIDMDEDVPLKDKIRKCVQIEVQQDDKMPPLICEDCVDKVNEYHHFLEMCLQTNTKTRHRLGLPALSNSESAGCILGITEPVYAMTKEESLPHSRASCKGPKHKIGPKSKMQQKSKAVHIATESREMKSLRESFLAAEMTKGRQTSLPAKRTTRHQVEEVKEPATSEPRGKRRAAEEAAPPCKKSKANAVIKCDICGAESANRAAASAHRVAAHRVSPTEPSLACDACRVWFGAAAAAAKHHARHRPYTCRTCERRCDTYTRFKEHFSKYQCQLFEEVPDLVCERCEDTFPTAVLLNMHKCVQLKTCGYCGKKMRSDLKRHETKCAARSKKKETCSICGMKLKSNLKRHETRCAASIKRKESQVKIEPSVRRQLLNMQVVVSRCDNLLNDETENHRYVTGNEIFGLDCKRTYPYSTMQTALSIKQEPLQDGMVSITEDILDFGGWDSEYSSDGSVEESILSRMRIDSLSNMSLKAVRRSMGKRKANVEVKDEFDQANDGNDMLSNDISDIINNTTWDDSDVNVSGGNLDSGANKGDVDFKISSILSGVQCVDEVKENASNASACFNESNNDNDDVNNDESANVTEKNESDLSNDKVASDETIRHENNDLNGSEIINNDDVRDSVSNEICNDVLNSNSTVSQKSLEHDDDDSKNTDSVKECNTDIMDDLDVRKEGSITTNDSIAETHISDEFNYSKLEEVSKTDLQNIDTNLRHENDVEINGDMNKIELNNTISTENEDISGLNSNEIKNGVLHQITHSDDSNSKQSDENSQCSNLNTALNDNSTNIDASEKKHNGVQINEQINEPKHLNESKNYVEEMYDEQLMRDINEHIGQNDSSDKNDFSEQNISDEEFNFDA